jgi:hypothetical protein
MTILSALRRRMSLQIKQLVKSRPGQSQLTLSHRWVVAKAGLLRPGHTVALVTSTAEAARLPSDVRRATDAARARGCAVEHYILDFDLDTLPPEFSKNAILRFWIDAAPHAADDVTNHGMSIPGDLSEAPYPLPDGGWATGYYKNGQPILFVTQHPGGTRVEHLGPGGQSLQKDEFDRNGRLMRRVDLDPATGKAAMHRYVDSQGKTWLSVRMGAEGRVGPVWKFHPQFRRYDSLADTQVAWLRDHLRQSNHALVLAGGDTSRSIMKRVAMR